MNRSGIAYVQTATNSGQINAPHFNLKDTFRMKKPTATNIRLKSYITKTNQANSNCNVKEPENAANIIKMSNIVCFDVDSTVIKEEGIDELAKFCGKGSEVSRVTNQAMEGGLTFQDALEVRLNIIRPSKNQVNNFIELCQSTLTTGVKEFISNLKAAGKQVYLISGGFDCLIEPVANVLNIPETNVFANKLCFYKNGDYYDFDRLQPTSRTGGKSVAVSIIKNKNPSAIITMIGDGTTDLEAVPPANYFIGFGGNIVRSEVFNRAQYFVTNFGQLWY